MWDIWAGLGGKGLRQIGSVNPFPPRDSPLTILTSLDSRREKVTGNKQFLFALQ